MPTAIEREAQAIKTEAKKILLIVVIISLVVYAFTGTAQVGQEQTGLVIRFGRIVKTLQPGLYWGYPWPIDKVVRIPTGVSHSLEVKNFNLDLQLVTERRRQLEQNNRFKQLSGTARSALANPYLVTADLNVVHLDLDVVYNITEPEVYYLAAGDIQDISNTNVQDIARKVIANALIQAVSQMEVMEALGEGQAVIQRRVQGITQKQFDRLELGITIRGADAVRVTHSLMPAPLQEVFDNVTTAQEAYRNLKHIAELRGQQLVNEAQAKVAAIYTKAKSYSEATIRDVEVRINRSISSDVFNETIRISRL